ncbi:hypothetical protein E4U21_007330 [Claviceps maximensis]|nr:hypothetical protein E4U21_007330 [Claviceps maximensis]
MAPSSISLPTLSIKSKSENIILTSAGELDIHIPDSCGIIGTAMELEQVVGNAQVWIAKQGLCHLMIDFSVNGIPISEADTLHHLETVMGASDVWKRLELGLVLVTESRGGRTNRVSYSIQHPDLSSALAPPNTASVAVFRSVLYSIDLLTSERLSISALKVKHCKDTETSTRIVCANDENEEYNNLASADRIAVDNFLENMTTNFEMFSPSSVPNKRQRLEDSRTDAVALSSNVKVLLSTWLEYVFLGRRRYSKTMALVQDIAPKPLSQLAPGVFDVAYLKVISLKIPRRLARVRLLNLNIPCPYEQCGIS